MTLDPRKLRYFIAVYEEGSVTRAAERENIVQPALSVHLRQLEEDLGQRLFDRSAQGAVPTPAGHELYGLATDLIDRMQAIRQRMLDGCGQMGGLVRVGLMPSICRGLLDVVRASFVEAHPKVELRITEATSGALGDAVTTGQLDLAIGNAPAAQTALKLRLLRRDPVVLVSGGPRYAAAGKELVLLELADLHLVLPSRQNAIRRLIDARLKTAEIKPSALVEIDGLGATLCFIAGSHWSTVVPSIAMLHDKNKSELTVNRLVDRDLFSDIYLIHAAERSPSLPAQALVDLVQNALGNLPSEIPQEA